MEKTKTGSKPVKSSLIHSRMITAMGEIGAIGKDSKNQQQGWKFRGIDTVYNELHSVLVKNKIFTIPQVLEERSEERKTKSGGNLIYRICK